MKNKFIQNKEELRSKKKEGNEVKYPLLLSFLGFIRALAHGDVFGLVFLVLGVMWLIIALANKKTSTKKNNPNMDDFKEPNPNMDDFNPDINDFTKIGELDDINFELFKLSSGLSVDSITYKRYKPILLKKNKIENKLILEYSNINELNFCLIIKEETEIYILNRNKTSTEFVLNKSILEVLSK